MNTYCLYKHWKFKKIYIILCHIITSFNICMIKTTGATSRMCALFVYLNKECSTIWYFVCYNQSWAPGFFAESVTSVWPLFAVWPHTVLIHFKEGPKYSIIITDLLFIPGLWYVLSIWNSLIQQGGKWLLFQ